MIVRFYLRTVLQLGTIKYMKRQEQTTFTFRLPVALKQRLDEESKRTGAPVAEIVRRAIDRYLGAEALRELQAKPKRIQYR